MSSKSTFEVPPGAVARVSIIDSTLKLDAVPVSYLMTPPIDGFETFPTIPSWSFLVESRTGKKALFDLGVPPDIETFAPVVTERLKNFGWDVKAEKHVADILRENKVNPASINSVIWSHWHWDHIGDPSTFPGTTDLVVGPGFKDAFYPGYPAKPGSPVREKDFEGRELVEIDFGTRSFKVGKFDAVDFFGDGSFYLLNTPGHAIGHLAGLARTSANPDTFIFMGGDLCHHGGEIRPSPYLNIPSQLESYLPSTLHAPGACPGGALFEEMNVKRGRKADEPFFDPAIGLDIGQAIQTIKDAQLADAQKDVFFIYAHDATIRGVVDLFPLPANDWSKKGWREKTLWAFLNDLASTLQVTKH